MIIKVISNVYVYCINRTTRILRCWNICSERTETQSHMPYLPFHTQGTHKYFIKFLNQVDSNQRKLTAEEVEIPGKVRIYMSNSRHELQSNSYEVNFALYYEFYCRKEEVQVTICMYMSQSLGSKWTTCDVSFIDGYIIADNKRFLVISVNI